MARNNFALTTPSALAMPAATAKTVLQLVAPAGTIVAVQGVDISFDGTSNTATPVVIQLFRQTTAGAGMTARAPLKTKDTSTALGSTGQFGSGTTTEPTNGDLLKTFHIHPQAGVVYPLPLPDGEIELPGGGRLGLVVTAPAAVNCLATIYGEE
jgi:hypothetical protein